MTKIERLEQRFVTSAPRELDPGILYISLEYTTMLHLCACGCGSKVVTPLSPKDWRFTFDGRTVSVNPSVGSWSLPCRSHYVIEHGVIRWAGDWTDEQIRRGREADFVRKRPASETLSADAKAIPASQPTAKKFAPSLLARVFNWLRSRL